MEIGNTSSRDGVCNTTEKIRLCKCDMNLKRGRELTQMAMKQPIMEVFGGRYDASLDSEQGIMRLYDNARSLATLNKEL